MDESSLELFYEILHFFVAFCRMLSYNLQDRIVIQNNGQLGLVLCYTNNSNRRERQNDE